CPTAPCRGEQGFQLFLGQPGVASSVDVGAQRHRAAVVVGNHVRSVEAPVRQQSRQHLALHIEGHPVVRLLRPPSVAGRVPWQNTTFGPLLRTRERTLLVLITTKSVLS